jgi:DNA-binding MarR family transcriptional regulator
MLATLTNWGLPNRGAHGGGEEEERMSREARTNARRARDAAVMIAAHDARDLFSFQLQRLASLSSRIANLSIGPRYRLTVREWRALAVLDYLQEAPLQELANHSGLLKSQMSRTVSCLIERGLIHRSDNPEDGRSVLLRLTPAGKDIVGRILADSEVRNEMMLASLSPAQRTQLHAAMRAVFTSSLAYYDRLRKEVNAESSALFDSEDQ